MRPEEELAAKVKELAEGYIRIANDLREIRRMLSPEIDDPLVQMCNRKWNEHQQGRPNNR